MRASQSTSFASFCRSDFEYSKDPIDPAPSDGRNDMIASSIVRTVIERELLSEFHDVCF